MVSIAHKATIRSVRSAVGGPPSEEKARELERLRSDAPVSGLVLQRSFGFFQESCFFPGCER